MKINNITLSIILASLVIINLVLLFLVIKNNNFISIKNTSKLYTIQYKSSPDFEQKLKDWNIKAIKSDPKIPKIAKITLETTNQVKPPYTYQTIKSTANTIPITNFSLVSKEGDKNIKILVYINPNEVQNQQYINGLRVMIPAGIIATIQNVNHSTTQENKFKDLLWGYGENPKNNPFTITLTKQ